MRVHVRDIAGLCPKCGAEDFETPAGAHIELTSETTLTCTACGAATSYLELVMQIARTAVARSNATLEEIRRHRK